MRSVRGNEQVDIVVIGAGIGGLMASAALTKAGKKVLVLEQLSFIGGKYTELEYHGYLIPTGAWTCPGRDSHIAQFCKEVGAQIEWRTYKELGGRQPDSLYLWEDGRAINQFEALVPEIIKDEKDRKAVNGIMMDILTKRDLPPSTMTSRQFIEQYSRSPDLLKFFELFPIRTMASQTVDTFPADQFVLDWKELFRTRETFGVPVGGTKTIVDALAKVIRDNGGEIRTRTRVERILTQGNTARGVKLVSGETILARTVIHDAGPSRLLKLVGENNLPATYVKRLKSLKPAWCGALEIGTTEEIREKVSLIITLNFPRDIMVFQPTYFDKTVAPSGRYLYDVFWSVETNNMEKELELVGYALHKIRPDLDQITEISVPMFFYRSWTAETAQCMGQSGEDRLNPKSPIGGLYIVGYDSVGYGQAGDLIPIGVRRTVEYIIGEEKMKSIGLKKSPP
jgi:phytoene dehydrogenase-like protein